MTLTGKAPEIVNNVAVLRIIFLTKPENSSHTLNYTIRGHTDRNF